MRNEVPSMTMSPSSKFKHTANAEKYNINNHYFTLYATYDYYSAQLLPPLRVLQQHTCSFVVTIHAFRVLSH